MFIAGMITMQAINFIIYMVYCTIKLTKDFEADKENNDYK